jgi:hypothetical protein
MSKKAVLIEIYDPPMCCPNGLCGPTIDPALLDIQEAILKVQREFGEAVKIERFLLSQQPARFVQNSAILALLKTDGTGVLPIVAINGEVRKTKSYPHFEELKEWVEARRNGHHEQA